jgi:hypothetical protein
MLATVLSSHVGDGVIKVTLVMARCRYRVMSVMTLLSYAMIALPRRLGHDVIQIPSYTGDGTAESCRR